MVKKKNDIFEYKINYKASKNWEKWVLCLSDIHYDSKHCDRKLLKKHCDTAKERDAIILTFGDNFDAMGGMYDPRSSKKDIRPEYDVKDYFDAIVNDAALFFEPYKENIKLVSEGNHEQSILKRQETDLTKRLAEKLGAEKGKYTGFLRFKFEVNNKNSTGGRISKLLYWTHGSGGNSPVTRGVIQTNRRQNFIQSDILVSGHIHNSWEVSLPIVKVSDQGVVKKREQLHISLGTYKDDSFNGGWSDTKGFPPPNMGGTWIRFFFNPTTKEIDFETIRAK